MMGVILLDLDHQSCGCIWDSGVTGKNCYLKSLLFKKCLVFLLFNICVTLWF